MKLLCTIKSNNKHHCIPLPPSLIHKMSERRQRFANEKHEYHDPRLLLGCWFDERARRETDFREYVDLYRRGELPVQKMENYVKSLNRQVRCTESMDGRIINGSTVGLAWQCNDIFLSALPKSLLPDGSYQQPCLAAGAMQSSKKGIPERSAITIYREDQRVPDNVPLMHGECLMLCLEGTPKRLFLNKDFLVPMAQNSVDWVEYSNSHTLWKISGKDVYIAINSPITVHHVTSGQRLTLDKSPIQTLLGVEHKVISTYEQTEPDTWRFVAPCNPLFINSDRHYLRCRNVWDILNHRY